MVWRGGCAGRKQLKGKRIAKKDLIKSVKPL
nr:MAG TPA: hypothetical protein [Caudoviricetes sp.]